jgi:hydroxymethylpyrimidine/phosphomethylpyrimidine kinase
MRYHPGMRGRVLVVAGSDSGGGAGIQADIKTITALGAYAATAVTALTAQNTLGVEAVLPVDPAFVRLQMRVVLDDIGADVVKTGMLHDVPVIRAVAEEIAARAPRLPVVVDPVMIAKGGAPLLEPSAKEALVRELFPLAEVVTPNAPEASALSGVEFHGEWDLVRAGERLIAAGARAAYVKGGHLPGDEAVDVLVTTAGLVATVRGPRVASRSTHGTGCTLASAIAASLAQGLDLERSVRRARDYVVRAIERAPGFGSGHGPLDHAWPLEDRS